MVVALTLAPWLAACSEPRADSPVVARGRQVYLTQCAVCHGDDPARGGPMAPAVKGSSRELLEAKVLRGTYPPGHRPKRSTRLMPPIPGLAADVPALVAFLQQP